VGRSGRAGDAGPHGWTHTAGPGGPATRRLAAQLVARGAAEFAALDAALTAAGLTVDGCTPPGWLASPGTVAAPRTARFGYLTVHRGLLDLRTGRRFPAFALSHRPGGFGQGLGAALMRAAARRGAGAEVRATCCCRFTDTANSPAASRARSTLGYGTCPSINETGERTVRSSRRLGAQVGQHGQHPPVVVVGRG
jgi:hypothetical protein